MPKPKAPTKTVANHMVRVKCPTSGKLEWANNSKAGVRCVKCAQTGHDRAVGV